MTTMTDPRAAIEETSAAPSTASRGALAGRVALITGAGSGLGAATAEVLAAAGAAVALADVDAAAAERTAGQIGGDGGGTIAVELDVRSADSARAAIEAIVTRFGRLDVLVNNAGTDVTDAFEAIPADAFDRVLDVNLRGPIVMTRAALPLLAASNHGHVVNIGSTAAFRGWPNASAYHTSKWGLRGLGQALFTELRDRGVRITTIFAGGMRTPFILDRFPEVSLDVLQDPHNVALAIRFALELPPTSVIPEITVLPVHETSWP
jgi:NAD(P)-dependent dehydrogenase (short-subunit alcohol dehydrogenase family)